MLHKNILPIHGGTLNNGDIIFGRPLQGKSTLIQRLNNNDYIKGLNSDQSIIDIDKKIIFPMKSEILEQLEFQTQKRFIFLKRLLLKQIGQKQQIKQIDLNQWKQYLRKDIINHFISILFWTKRTQYIENPWINKFSLLKDIFYDRLNFLLDKLINENNLKPLVITTNTDDINTKCTLIEDKEQNICYFA